MPEQKLLVTLDKLYGGRSVRHDAFGRRMALPSEIAHLLAAQAEDARGSSTSIDRSGFESNGPAESSRADLR
jgi:hypothetical protein